MVLTQRILILITIIFVLGGPYTIFIILEAFSIRRAPSYSHRIGFMFIAIACCLSIVTILYYAQTARETIFKKNSSRKYELKRLNSNNGKRVIQKKETINSTRET